MATSFGVSSVERLVGREAELAVAAAALRELGEGRASVLAIEGEAGIGKTGLVQSIVGDARSRGVAVFSGQAHPSERARPFGVVVAALGLSRRSPDARRAGIGALQAGEGAGAVGDVQFGDPARALQMVDTLEQAFANGEPDPKTAGLLLAQIDMEMLAPAAS